MFIIDIQISHFEILINFFSCRVRPNTIGTPARLLDQPRPCSVNTDDINYWASSLEKRRGNIMKQHRLQLHVARGQIPSPVGCFGLVNPHSVGCRLPVHHIHVPSTQYQTSKISAIWQELDIINFVSPGEKRK